MSNETQSGADLVLCFELGALPQIPAHFSYAEREWV
jgi:hypothetical protein